MDDLADITSEVQRLMANATFVRSATRRGVERALSQTMHGPTEHAIGVPLRDLVDSRQLKTRRVPAPELLSTLDSQFWTVLDEALPPQLVEAASREAQHLHGLGLLGRQPGLSRLRLDHSSTLPVAEAAWPSLSALLRRLHGAARRLSRWGALGSRKGGLLPDPAGGMLACYNRGDRYSMHVDRADACTGEACSSGGGGGGGGRRATAIVYLRHGSAWSPAEAGELRLWPSSAQSPSQSALLVAGSAVDVEPLAGRLVLFDSRLAHEVRPWRAEGGRVRCALTLWVHDAGT